jgi:hypothetical protein
MQDGPQFVLKTWDVIEDSPIEVILAQELEAGCQL